MARKQVCSFQRHMATYATQCLLCIHELCIYVCNTYQQAYTQLSIFWRVKRRLLFKGRNLLSGYFLIKMSPCGGCSKLCRAQRDKEGEPAGPAVPRQWVGARGTLNYDQLVRPGLVTDHFGSSPSQWFASFLCLPLSLAKEYCMQ